MKSVLEILEAYYICFYSGGLCSGGACKCLGKHIRAGLDIRIKLAGETVLTEYAEVEFSGSENNFEHFACLILAEALRLEVVDILRIENHLRVITEYFEEVCGFLEVLCGG